MIDDKELAAIIARKIFEAGAMRSAVPATRIQFMIGHHPEMPGGGFGEASLADHIEHTLNKYRTY